MRGNDSSRPRSKFRALIAVFILLLTSVGAVVTAPTEADAATFRGWEFSPVVSSIRSDGLALEDVSFNGVRVFERISLPAMNVFYDNDVCGPYVDRIGGSRYDYESPQEFTQDGVRWMSIGLTDQIGAYVITQMFYLSENGDFDAHIFSKGLQCNTRHDHIPFWRIDFDIAGSATDQIRRATNGGMVTMSSEFSSSATAAVNHGWEVRDSSTGDFVTIDFDDGNFGIAGEQVIPESNYLTNNVFGRQYRSSEQSWQGGATYGLFGDGGETMTNPVLWYSGYLPHSPAEGPSLWHSTGIRMRVNPQVGQDATIGGRVRDSSGQNMSGAKVDLFTENRASFVEATTTGGDGRYSFSVSPGCYVMTFIAPDGTSFNGSRYQNRSVCVSAGETSNANDATVVSAGGGAASVGDRVTFSNGSPAPGVKLNLFTENRAQFLGVTTTDSNGNYRFDLASAGCYVVTFIAPNNSVFAASGGAFQNTPFCLSNGQTLNSVDAVLVGSGSQGTLGGRVTNATGGAGVSSIKLVLYQANGDGSRGAWVRPVFTNGSGNFTTQVTPGCYVFDYVAPNGRTWASSGGQYVQRSTCVSAGQSIDNLNERLN